MLFCPRLPPGEVIEYEKSKHYRQYGDQLRLVRLDVRVLRVDQLLECDQRVRSFGHQIAVHVLDGLLEHRVLLVLVHRYELLVSKLLL